MSLKNFDKNITVKANITEDDVTYEATNQNKTKVYYNANKNAQKPIVQENIDNKTKPTLSTNITNNNPSNNPKSVPISSASNIPNVYTSNTIFNSLKNVFVIGCFSFFVIFLFAITKKYYSRRKGKRHISKNGKNKSNLNNPRHTLNDNVNNNSANFPFKNKFGRKSRELIPSILMVSPAPLASLSDEAIKYNEKTSVDKDINVHDSIIQAQSYDRNSMNLSDIRTVSWQPINGYQYPGDISRSSSTEVTTDIDRGTSLSEPNKLDNVVEVYFSNKRVDIMRQNTSSSCYSNIPDNASSTGEPSLSRYIDNDALLKYESSKCKLNMYDNSLKPYGNRTSIQSSTVPSLSRYNVKNISSAIASRNNNEYQKEFYNKAINSYSNHHPNSTIVNSAGNRQSVGSNLNEENLKSKYNQKLPVIHDVENETLSSCSSQATHKESKTSINSNNSSSNDSNTLISEITNNNSLSNGAIKIRPRKDSYSVNKMIQLNNYSDSDSSSDLEEELENISHLQKNSSKTIEIDTINNTNPNIEVRAPMSLKNSNSSEFPTIVVNSQNSSSTPTESVYYRY